MIVTPEEAKQMNSKRKPTLADRFAYSRNPLMANMIGGPKQAHILQARTRAARRFVFDEEASERVAHVIKEIPELILRESQFARAPYELTWIEYQARPYWKVHNDGKAIEDATSDTRVGFLIDHNRVNVVSEREDDDSSGVGIYPIAYHLNTEWPLEDQLRFAKIMQVSRIGIDTWMWGSSAEHFLNSGQHDKLRHLRDHNRADILCDIDFLESAKEPYALLQGAQGDMRTIIAFLLMLNRPSIVKYLHTLPNKRGWLKNRVVPFMSHTTVKVSLDAAQTLKLIGTPQGESIERRWHEVRGHYCHNKIARDHMRLATCIHDWKPTAGPEDDWEPRPYTPVTEIDHWVCAVCSGKRWWRTYPEGRGSAAVGFVNHDGYEISDKNRVTT